jgi:carbon storage regulator
LTVLCLSRKLNERILIGGGITVTVLAIGQGRVRLGITAPG